MPWNFRGCDGSRTVDTIDAPETTSERGLVVSQSLDAMDHLVAKPTRSYRAPQAVFTGPRAALAGGRPSQRYHKLSNQPAITIRNKAMHILGELFADRSPTVKIKCVDKHSGGGMMNDNAPVA